LIFSSDFEVAGSKVKCTKCAPLLMAQEARQWIDSAGWKTHLKSGIHARALKHEVETLQRATRIDQAAMAEDAEHATNFASLTASLLSGSADVPKNPQIISANEQAMWDSLDIDDIAFSAGTAPDEMVDHRHIEQELKDADMWDGTNLVGGLGMTT
jgi:hypothetical protein